MADPGAATTFPAGSGQRELGGPEAPVVAADLEGTCTTGETWRAVGRWLGVGERRGRYLRFLAPRLAAVPLVRAGLIDRQAFRDRWMRDLARLLDGLTTAELEALGEAVVEEDLWPNRRPDVIAELETAAARGARVVVASGTYDPVLQAFIARLDRGPDAGEIAGLGTPLEVRDGRATGRLAGPVRTGPRKLERVRDFAAGAPIETAYGDSLADVPLLEAASHPIAVAPDTELRRIAAARGWRIVEICRGFARVTRARARAPRALSAAIGAALLVALVAPARGAAPARAADPAAGGPSGPIDVATGVPSAGGPGVVPVVGSAVPGPRLVWRGPRDGRVVALTFDDGWSAANLRRIHRILVREDVAATFFVTGMYVQRAPALWRRVAASGFLLAGHSFRHRDARLLTAREAARDFALTRAAIEGATGRPMLPMFRPPYGARTAATDRLAAAAGFPIVVMWDVTGGDAERGASVRSVVRNATRGGHGAIVLLHVGPRVTPRALPGIIARYRARGFGFVTVPDLLGLPPDLRVVGPDAPAILAPDSPPARAMDLPDGHAGEPEPPPAAPASGPGPVPAAAPSAAAPPAPPKERPARDAAWARQDGTPAQVGGFTAGTLVLLIVVAAIRGRRRGHGDEPGASGEPVAGEPAAATGVDDGA